MSKAAKTTKKARAAQAAAPVGSHMERRDEAEGRLLAAATEIIARHGVDGLTLGQVGTAAGYSRGLPAHYYGNKTGLLEAVAWHITDGFANRLAQTENFKPGLEMLLGAVANYLAPTTAKGPVTLLTVIMESLTEPALRPAVSKVTERSVRRLAAMVRTAIDNGEIREDIDPEKQAVLILGTMRSLTLLWLLNPKDIRMDAIRDAYVGGLKRMLCGKG
jgi:AcrR family transcriptional regulator